MPETTCVATTRVRVRGGASRREDANVAMPDKLSPLGISKGYRQCPNPVV